MTDPEGAVIQAQVIASGRNARLALPAARTPGVYLVKQGGLVVGAQAVNIDPRESDTRPIAMERLKTGTGAPVEVVKDEADLLLGEKLRPLWPKLALLLAAALATEMLLLTLWRRKPLTEVPGPLSSVAGKRTL